MNKHKLVNYLWIPSVCTIFEGVWNKWGEVENFNLTK